MHAAQLAPACPQRSSTCHQAYLGEDSPGASVLVGLSLEEAYGCLLRHRGATVWSSTLQHPGQGKKTLEAQSWTSKLLSPAPAMTTQARPHRPRLHLHLVLSACAAEPRRKEIQSRGLPLQGEMPGQTRMTDSPSRDGDTSTVSLRAHEHIPGTLLPSIFNQMATTQATEQSLHGAHCAPTSKIKRAHTWGPHPSSEPRSNTREHGQST